MAEKTVEGKTDVVNSLNNHFVNIANFLNKTKFDSDDFIALKNYLDSKLIDTTFNLEYITPYEVGMIIQKLPLPSWQDNYKMEQGGFLFCNFLFALFPLMPGYIFDLHRLFLWPNLPTQNLR